jgi:hypothetical protein
MQEKQDQQLKAVICKTKKREIYKNSFMKLVYFRTGTIASDAEFSFFIFLYFIKTTDVRNFLLVYIKVLPSQDNAQ